MTKQIKLGGAFALPGTSMTLNRMGYGTMQLAGPGVWGPPRDLDAAIAVLREAVEAGVNQSGCSSRCRQVLDACSLASGVDRCRS